MANFDSQAETNKTGVWTHPKYTYGGHYAVQCTNFLVAGYAGINISSDASRAALTYHNQHRAPVWLK